MGLVVGLILIAFLCYCWARWGPNASHPSRRRDKRATYRDERGGFRG